MGEQRNNCKIEIKSKAWKNVSNGFHEDEPADSGCCSGFWKRNEEEDECSVMILPVLPCWHVRTPKAEVPGWSSMFATSQLSSRTASRTLLHFYLFRSACLSFPWALPPFVWGQKRTNHSLLNVPTCSFTNPYVLFSLSFLAVITYSLSSGSLPDYSQAEMSSLKGVTCLHPWVLIKQEGFNSPSSPIPLSFPSKRWCVFVNPFLQTSEVFQTEGEIIFFP